MPRAVVAVGVFGLVALGTAACSDDDDGTEAADPLGLGESAAGTCLQFEEEVGAEVTELPVIDCAEPHSHEIFAVVEHPDDVYPGFEALETFAQQECLAEFEPFVGTNAFDSELFHTWLVPTLDGWNEQDDREVVCVLGRQDGAAMTGSMRGATI